MGKERERERDESGNNSGSRGMHDNNIVTIVVVNIVIA